MISAALVLATLTTLSNATLPGSPSGTEEIVFQCIQKCATTYTPASKELQACVQQCNLLNKP